jgi:hypothetical protein
MNEELEGLAAREAFIDNLNNKGKSNTRVKNTKYTAILAHQGRVCRDDRSSYWSE